MKIKKRIAAFFLLLVIATMTSCNFGNCDKYRISGTDFTFFNMEINETGDTIIPVTTDSIVFGQKYLFKLDFHFCKLDTNSYSCLGLENVEYNKIASLRFDLQYSDSTINTLLYINGVGSGKAILFDGNYWSPNGSLKFTISLFNDVLEGHGDFHRIDWNQNVFEFSLPKDDFEPGKFAFLLSLDMENGEHFEVSHEYELVE